MKRWILLGAVAIWLAVYTYAVKAETWVLPNTSGGEITLTTQTCKADNGKWQTLKHAYTWTDKTYMEGCWTVVDGNVHVTWVFSNGDRERRVYRPSDFTKKEGL